MNRCIKEGMNSFHDNKGKYINPYEIGSDEFNDFERGWTQALKRSSNQLLKSYRLFIGIEYLIR
jgi:hypothetical protein